MKREGIPTYENQRSFRGSRERTTRRNGGISSRRVPKAAGSSSSSIRAAHGWRLVDIGRLWGWQFNFAGTAVKPRGLSRAKPLETSRKGSSTADRYVLAAWTTEPVVNRRLAICHFHFTRRLPSVASTRVDTPRRDATPRGSQSRDWFS